MAITLGLFVFNVWQPGTIRTAIAQAIDLANSGQHHLARPFEFLDYDPSVEHHVTRVMEVLEPARTH